jgi:transcriptional regulator with PAS, ATPase and Fis domain
VERGILSETVTERVLQSKDVVTRLNRTKTGRILLVTGRPILDEAGNIYLVIVTGRDVTELVELRQEVEQKKEVVRRYRQELECLRNKYFCDSEVVVQSREMQNVIEFCHRVALADAPVLILGESGVGKEVVAHLIHRVSSRANKPFISVNCSAIPAPLVESELFGHERGSFTGANQKGKAGLFEVANGGTIFLDEIGEIPLADQAKLLHVLETREVRRLGATKPIKVDVRIIAATNRDLKTMVKEGKFREDLYFRLNVFPITVPPLRQRRDDIVPLILYFLDIFSHKYGTKKKLTTEALNALVAYDWPGNVRELRNLLERLMVIVEDTYIELHHLPEEIQSHYQPSNRAQQQPQTFMEVISAIEKDILEKALQTYGSTRRAAQALGLTQSTFVRKLHRCRNSSKTR